MAPLHFQFYTRTARQFGAHHVKPAIPRFTKNGGVGRDKALQRLLDVSAGQRIIPGAGGFNRFTGMHTLVLDQRGIFLRLVLEVVCQTFQQFLQMDVVEGVAVQFGDVLVQNSHVRTCGHAVQPSVE